MSAIRRFIVGPELPDDARRTFRFHRAYAVLDGVVGGILLNTPIFALKVLGIRDWQLPLRDFGTGIGMLAALYMGSWIARRPKMPFIVIPGVLSACFSLSMALATRSEFWFLILYSISALFEVVTRPPIAAVLRLNYPVEHRAQAVGEVRKWSSLTFLVANFASGVGLQFGGEYIRPMLQAQIVVAGVASLAAFFCFRAIRANHDPQERRDLRLEIVRHLRASIEVVLGDGRYRRHLAGCFLDNFSQMLYASLIFSLFGKTLLFGYVACVVLTHSLPAACAFALTGVVGRWIDRSNPWVAWFWIRLVYGIDAVLLAATPFCAAACPPALYLLPVAGRLLRGSVQGGYWILWWQIGVTHFAPPGEDTSRYMGVMTFLYGATRLLGAGTAVLLTAAGVAPLTLIACGGAGMIGSGLYSLYEAFRERGRGLPQTIAEFERQFAGEPQR